MITEAKAVQWHLASILVDTPIAVALGLLSAKSTGNIGCFLDGSC